MVVVVLLLSTYPTREGPCILMSQSGQSQMDRSSGRVRSNNLRARGLVFRENLLWRFYRTELILPALSLLFRLHVAVVYKSLINSGQVSVTQPPKFAATVILIYDNLTIFCQAELWRVSQLNVYCRSIVTIKPIYAHNSAVMLLQSTSSYIYSNH